MILDLLQDFEFPGVNSLLLWSISWQDKKDKNQWNYQWICDI